jgi:DNA (cytosine-5)-methyltransferase 1
MNFYNENDHKAAAWIRELITAGLIPPGHVDERSIADISPADLDGYTQCHFFAGIAGWVLALQLAGWPSDRPVWTGSCPCQPFSSATRGRSNGLSDEKHLWPELFRLIRSSRPAFFFGEQVSNALPWLDEVGNDLENENYTFWPVSLPAYCAGADHERERIYFAAHSDMHGKSGGSLDAKMALLPRPGCNPGRMAQKNGIPAGVAFRGFGNAIVPQVAAEFILACLDLIPTPTQPQSDDPTPRLS